MKKLCLIALSAAVICSCKMQQLYIDVIQPAPVTLPAYIKTPGIIDRSEPSEASKALDAVDKVLSLEGASLDRAGAEAAVAGLAGELGSNERFGTVNVIAVDKSQAPGIGIFPPPLSRERIAEICTQNKVDAVFSLELFDTDTKVSYQVKGAKGKTVLGAILSMEQQADMHTLVKTGWRIYDPSAGTILDEIMISRDLTFSATGLTPVIAANALIDRKEAVKRVGAVAGTAFARRILPYQVKVTRDYFVKGNDNFRIAMRKARTGNWDEAEVIWLKETENPSSSVAGRACYNMAIISEINGSTDTAIEWARKAYEDYNNRPALRYVRILEYRKADQLLLEQQQER